MCLQGGPGLLQNGFCRLVCAGIVGATLHLYICNMFFYDISLLISISNKLLSQFL